MTGPLSLAALTGAISWIPAIGGAVAALAVAAWASIRRRTRIHSLEENIKRSRRRADELEREVAAHRENRQIIEAVLSEMREGVLVVGLDGEFLLVNRQFERMLGVPTAPNASPAEWPRLYGAFHGETGERLREEDLVMPRAARGETIERYQVVFRNLAHPDGLHVEGSARPIRDESGAIWGAVGIQRDVTEIRRAEAARRRLIEDLERRNAELERFTYTVSHDLRSPLVTIKGFLGYLQRHIEIGEVGRVRADLRRISEAAATMTNLLDELLELSRVGRVVGPAEEVRLDAVVAEAVRQVTGRDSTIRVEVAPDLPVVSGDRLRLYEVFQNLIENAVKFMGDQPEPRIEIGWRDDGDEIAFFVRDNGRGIEPADHQRVFDLFGRLDPEVEGTGVGLTLVKRIIEVHGGRIWIESAGAGAGSTFWLTLD